MPDVRQVKVLENNTKQRDKYGVEPNSLNIIVDGGADEQIAHVIYENKGAGVGLQGAAETTLTVNGERRAIRFDRATPVDVQVLCIVFDMKILLKWIRMKSNDYYPFNALASGKIFRFPDFIRQLIKWAVSG